jgi:hypothetical protein
MTWIVTLFLAVNAISGRFLPRLGQLGRNGRNLRNHQLEWQGNQKMLPRKTTWSDKLKPNRKALKFAGKVKREFIINVFQHLLISGFRGH